MSPQDRLLLAIADAVRSQLDRYRPNITERYDELVAAIAALREADKDDRQ